MKQKKSRTVKEWIIKSMRKELKRLFPGIEKNKIECTWFDNKYKKRS